MPYNLALHNHLVLLGYLHSHENADFDDGDPENSPGTWGHLAYDTYEGLDEYVFVSETGETDRQNRDNDLERWLANAMPPEGVTVIGLDDPTTLHNTIKDALGE